MARRERKMFEPGLDPAAYNLQGLKTYSLKELQHEYARIREEARDRLRGFERSSEWRTSKTYLQNKDQFPAMKTRKEDRRTLEHKIIEGIRFVTAKGTSVTGAKAIQADMIQTFHEHGHDWVNRKNIRAVGDFLEWAREQGQDRAYGSATLLDIFAWAQDNDIRPDELKASFDMYSEQYEFDREG